MNENIFMGSPEIKKFVSEPRSHEEEDFTAEAQRTQRRERRGDGLGACPGL
jgi:hypothetical protein